MHGMNRKVPTLLLILWLLKTDYYEYFPQNTLYLYA